MFESCPRQYEIATSFFGAGGVGNAADIVGELEGAIIEATATVETTSQAAFEGFDSDGNIPYQCNTT